MRRPIHEEVQFSAGSLSSAQDTEITAVDAITEFGADMVGNRFDKRLACLLYTSPSPRDATLSRMPSSA